MITSFVISLREGLEAALIISIALGVLRRTGHPEHRRSLWAGAIFAGFLSLLIAVLLRTIGEELEGTAEQIFEGVTLLLAAGVLTWMVFWISRQSREEKIQLENKITLAANRNSSRGVFLLGFISVLREGIELVLYIFATSLASGSAQTLFGTTSGLLVAGLVGYLLYTATIRINLRRFFQLTGIILVLFAAGLVAQSIAEFNEAGVIPTIINPIWNLNPFLDDHSTVGIILSTLFGYRGSPSLTQALGYSIYILLIVYFILKARKFQVR